MKILVCGGAGFIGSTFIKNLLKNNSAHEIKNLDSLTIGSNLDNLKEIENNLNYEFIKDDIKNQDIIEKKQTDFMSGVFGGPSVYAGKSPRDAHVHIFITPPSCSAA